MTKFLILWLFFFSGCATEIYEDGRLVCRIQSDATGVEFSTPKGTRFKAASLNNSAPTAAATTGATSVIGAAGAAIATNRVIK